MAYLSYLLIYGLTVVLSQAVETSVVVGMSVDLKNV